MMMIKLKKNKSKLKIISYLRMKMEAIDILKISTIQTNFLIQIHQVFQMDQIFQFQIHLIQSRKMKFLNYQETEIFKNQ